MKQQVELGQTIYGVYHSDAIIVLSIYAIGRESFITANFCNGAKEDAYEWYLDEYKKSWFETLDEAKKELWRRVRRDCDPEEVKELELVQVEPDYYEIQYQLPF